MRRISIVLVAVVAVVTVAAARLSAQSATASLSVTASVTKNCTIAAAPVNFGNYDPIKANATAPLDSIGVISVTCTKGAAAKVGLNAGSNAQGSTRRMVAAAAEFLNYELYKDTARTIVWGNTETDGLDVPAAPNRNPRNYTVYGRIAAAQDASVGTYTDTVVATVNF